MFSLGITRVAHFHSHIFGYGLDYSVLKWALLFVQQSCHLWTDNRNWVKGVWLCSFPSSFCCDWQMMENNILSGSEKRGLDSQSWLCTTSFLVADLYFSLYRTRHSLENEFNLTSYCKLLKTSYNCSYSCSTGLESLPENPFNVACKSRENDFLFRHSSYVVPM